MSSTEYSEENIQTLHSPEAIRHRPVMFIGCTGAAGLHLLLRELLANSLDEVKAGFGDHVGVTLFADGSCSVTDAGRGIGRQIEVALTQPGFSTKTEYRTGNSIHGLGLKVVAALSEWGEIESSQTGEHHRVEFERGCITAEPKVLRPAGDRTGTTVRFKPDPEIFGDLTFDLAVILNRLCELAFLHAGVRFTFTDERTGKTDTFHFPDGLLAFVKYLNTGEETLHEPIRLGGEVETISVDVAFQYHRGCDTIVRSYTNGGYLPQGGTHILGFRRGLREAIKRFAKSHDCWPTGLAVMPEDIREGVTAVVCVEHPTPQYEGATKSKLNNVDVEPAVARVVREGLSKYLAKNPDVGQRLCQHIKYAAQARVAANLERHAVRAARRGT